MRHVLALGQSCCDAEAACIPRRHKPLRHGSPAAILADAYKGDDTRSLGIYRKTDFLKKQGRRSVRRPVKGLQVHLGRPPRFSANRDTQDRGMRKVTWPWMGCPFFPDLASCAGLRARPLTFFGRKRRNGALEASADRRVRNDALRAPHGAVADQVATAVGVEIAALPLENTAGLLSHQGGKTLARAKAREAVLFTDSVRGPPRPRGGEAGFRPQPPRSGSLERGSRDKAGMAFASNTEPARFCAVFLAGR